MAGSVLSLMLPLPEHVVIHRLCLGTGPVRCRYFLILCVDFIGCCRVDQIDCHIMFRVWLQQSPAQPTDEQVEQPL
jgi:hypothetical protein